MDHIFSDANRPFVSKRLVTRLGIFSLISFVLIFLVVLDVFHGQLTWMTALISVVVGLILGFVYGRLSRVQWHETEEKIVMRYDMLGFVLIGAYVVLSIFRDLLLDKYFSGVALVSISYAVLAGVLIGRFFGLQVAIMRVLRERKAK